MKLVLILIISITAAFAQNTDQNILHAEEMVTKSSQKAKRKARGLKRILNRLTHDFQTEKMVNTSERKERRKFKVIRFLEKIKNSIGPVDVKSVESENPNKLLFVVTGKTKHFKVHSAKFAIGEISQGLNWATSGENITVSELEGGKYSLEVDISSVEIGEHKLVMNIKYTLGRRQRLKLTRISKSIFEKIQTETAHAELLEISANPQNSRIGFDMGSSYSDIGNILSYTIDTIKDGEVIATQTLDPLVSGTYFTQSFHMEGIYQVKLTVIDESGDTDSTLSREYEVISPAPIVELAVTQNEEYKDIFEFDLTGTKMESGSIDYIYLYFARSLEETGGAYEELDFKFISGQDFRDSQDLKFNYKTTARGNVFVGAFVVSTDGVSNFFDIYGLNIPETPKESIFLDLSHNFKRDGYPYTQVYAFPASIDEAQFKQFNIKVTDASGNSTDTIQDYTDSGSGFFHVYVDTKKSGEFDVEITLETNEGLLSLPFNTSLTVEEVDFGVATLDLNLYFTPEDESRRHVNWDVYIENSNPGNFGYFTDFYCDFNDQEDSNNNFRVENEGTQNYWIEIPRGNYEVDCFGRTSVGLISSNELKFQIDARNKAPSIQNVHSSLTDQNFLTYSINIDAIDEDGFIAKVLVKEVYSNGVSNEYEADNFISVNAQGLVGGDGYVDIELIAVDGEGAQSEPYSLRVDFENLAPSFEIIATLLDENTKEYQFDFQMSDDGYVERQIFTAIAPTGNVYSYDAFNVVEQFLNEAPGIWTIQVEGIDNLGKSTVKSIQVEVENKAPEVLALNVFPVNENERLFEIVPDVVDYDGYLIADELIITFPSGSSIQGNPGTGPSQWNLNEPGNYVISYRAQDNAGNWSEVFTTNYSVINKAPVAVFEITQVSQDRWFVVTESSYDEDGFIIEHRFAFTGPQGESITRSESGSFDIQLASPGIWNVGYDVKDNDQDWSGRVISEVEVINEEPVIEISYELVDPSTRTYRFNANILDDFGDFSQYIKMTAPDGTTSEIETEFPTERVLDQVGVWGIEARVVDIDGITTTSKDQINVINILPEVEISFENLGESTQMYRLNSSFSDPDGQIQTAEIVLISPLGEEESLAAAPILDVELATEGIWEIKLTAVDNEGGYNESKIEINVDTPDPSISLSAQIVEQALKLYEININVENPPLSSEFRAVVTSPSGDTKSYYNSELFTISLKENGSWTFLSQILKDGEVLVEAEKVVVVDLNQKPVCSVLFVGGQKEIEIKEVKCSENIEPAGINLKITDTKTQIVTEVILNQSQKIIPVCCGGRFILEGKAVFENSVESEVFVSPLIDVYDNTSNEYEVLGSRQINHPEGLKDTYYYSLKSTNQNLIIRWNQDREGTFQSDFNRLGLTIVDQVHSEPPKIEVFDLTTNAVVESLEVSVNFTEATSINFTLDTTDNIVSLYNGEYKLKVEGNVNQLEVFEFRLNDTSKIFKIKDSEGRSVDYIVNKIPNNYSVNFIPNDRTGFNRTFDTGIVQLSVRGQEFAKNITGCGLSGEVRFVETESINLDTINIISEDHLENVSTKENMELGYNIWIEKNAGQNKKDQAVLINQALSGLFSISGPLDIILTDLKEVDGRPFDEIFVVPYLENTMFLSLPSIKYGGQETTMLYDKIRQSLTHEYRHIQQFRDYQNIKCYNRMGKKGDFLHAMLESDAEFFTFQSPDFSGESFELVSLIRKRALLDRNQQNKGSGWIEEYEKIINYTSRYLFIDVPLEQLNNINKGVGDIIFEKTRSIAVFDPYFAIGTVEYFKKNNIDLLFSLESYLVTRSLDYELNTYAHFNAHEFIGYTFANANRLDLTKDDLVEYSLQYLIDPKIGFIPRILGYDPEANFNQSIFFLGSKRSTFEVEYNFNGQYFIQYFDYSYPLNYENITIDLPDVSFITGVGIKSLEGRDKVQQFLYSSQIFYKGDTPRYRAYRPSSQNWSILLAHTENTFVDPFNSEGRSLGEPEVIHIQSEEKDTLVSTLRRSISENSMNDTPLKRNISLISLLRDDMNDSYRGEVDYRNPESGIKEVSIEVIPSGIYEFDPDSGLPILSVNPIQEIRVPILSNGNLGDPYQVDVSGVKMPEESFFSVTRTDENSEEIIKDTLSLSELPVNIVKTSASNSVVNLTNLELVNSGGSTIEINFDYELSSVNFSPTRDLQFKLNYVAKDGTKSKSPPETSDFGYSSEISYENVEIKLEPNSALARAACSGFSIDQDIVITGTSRLAPGKIRCDLKVNRFPSFYETYVEYEVDTPGVYTVCAPIGGQAAGPLRKGDISINPDLCL